MTDVEILELVKQMREAQRRWFRDHDRTDLRRSKELEGQVDRALAARFSPQGNLL